MLGEVDLNGARVTPPGAALHNKSPVGYSRFQMTGMIEWGQKSKPKKIPGPKCNPKKSHAEFPKNFQKALNKYPKNRNI